MKEHNEAAGLCASCRPPFELPLLARPQRKQGQRLVPCHQREVEVIDRQAAVDEHAGLA